MKNKKKKYIYKDPYEFNDYSPDDISIRKAVWENLNNKIKQCHFNNHEEGETLVVWAVGGKPVSWFKFDKFGNKINFQNKKKEKKENRIKNFNEYCISIMDKRYEKVEILPEEIEYAGLPENFLEL